jgi:PPK2 family polyphosphate:nucleotide phosphotransferase
VTLTRVTVKYKERIKEIEKLTVRPRRKVSMDDFDPGYTWKGVKKKHAKELLRDGVIRLAALQDKFYAQDTYALLIVLQAMDAAGKDGTIRHVMSGLNPQGCQVYSFKGPSAEERDHDYLWRSMKALPERGRIGIHNRSYYEEVLVARVHPHILEAQQLPAEHKNDGIWKERYEQINNFEDYLVNNGVIVLKFFLNVSRQEQKRRFLDRLDRKEKNWKFSVNDVKERAYWKDYQKAYEDLLGHTSTKRAPWHVIPADNKWFARLAVAAVIHTTMEGLNLRYPKVGRAQKQELLAARALLDAEKD